MKSAFHWLIDLHNHCHFASREGKNCARASTSELKRWLQNGVVVVNGERLADDELMDFPIFSVVLFPKNADKRVTLV